MNKDNGKDEQPQPQPQEGQQQVPVLAQIVHNPETNEMGIVLAPAVTDHILFATGIQELAIQMIREAHIQNKGRQSRIARPNPGGILRP